jgi:hypothetical protein
LIHKAQQFFVFFDGGLRFYNGAEIIKRGIMDIMKLAVVFDGKEVWIKKGA